MDIKSELLPAKADELKEKLPGINNQFMSRLTLLPEELRKIPENLDYEYLIEHGEKIIEFHERYYDHTGMALGALLIIVKSKYGEGKWYEALGRLGIAPRRAQVFMKNARDFGDTLELVEGMGYNKITRLGALPDSFVDELKENGRVMLPDGREITMTEFKRMTFRELSNEVTNIRNQLNAKLRDANSRAEIAEAEMKEMRKESKEREDFLKKYMKDKDAATAEKIEKLNALLSDVEAEKNKLKLELMDKNQEQFTDQEVTDAIAEAKKAIDEVFMKINNVKLSYWKTDLIAKVKGFITEAQEQIRWTSIKIENKIDEGLDDDSTAQSA